MQDTDAFFTPEPTRDYVLKPSPSDPRSAGGKPERWNSPARSPRRTPRTTWCARVFSGQPDQARSQRRQSSTPRRCRARAVEFGSRRARRPLPDAGPARRRLAPHQPALPRRPQAARTEARRLHRQLERRPHRPGLPPGRDGRAPGAGWLRDQGYEHLGLLGTSLGSCLSLLTDLSRAAGPRAGAQPRVTLFFGDVVWRGLSTEHVRSGLNGHIHAGDAALGVAADQPVVVSRSRPATGRRCSSTPNTT